MNDLIGKIHCGDGDVRNQFNAMKSVVDGSFVALQPPFATVNSQFENAWGAASGISGVYLNIQNRHGMVASETRLAQAGLDGPGGVRAGAADALSLPAPRGGR
jgi:hypothetical protein